MGHNITRAAIPPWLDEETAALLADTVQTLAERFSDILRAVVLFGSVARHEERSLNDPWPSDVDVLAIFDVEDTLIEPYRHDIFMAIGDACRQHLDAPREVTVLLVPASLAGWNPQFLDNVARDGMVLYARGPLPAALEQRRLSAKSA
jgi:predicted nucleotidyltransferase